MRRPTLKDCKLEQEKAWEIDQKLKKMSQRDPKYRELTDDLMKQGRKLGSKVGVYWRREGKLKGKLKGIEE